MSKLEQHPLSKLFPPMPPNEFRELVEDIRRQGVLEPIKLLDGQVLDGWHRYLACQEIGIEPPTHDWSNPDGREEAFRHVWARNALRRHLTAAQRVRITAEANPKLWEKVGTETGDIIKSGLSSAEHLAGIAGVHPNTVRQAKKVEREAPDLWEQAQRGDISVKHADAQRLLRQVEERSSTQRQERERDDMEWRTRFVAEVLEKIKRIKEVKTDVHKGLAQNQFSPEAKPFIVRQLDGAIKWLSEAQEELKQ